MARKRQNIVLEQVHLIDAGAKGVAVGKLATGQVVFVKNAVPGDVVDVRVQKKKKQFMEGVPVHFHQYSTERVEPVCKHFGTCGGCKWQNLDYSRQLHYKQNEVENNLRRLGHVVPEQYLPIFGSSEIYNYRNKLEFSFSSLRWLSEAEIQSGADIAQRNGLGFHIPGMWDKVLDINECHLQKDPSNAIRNFVRTFANKNNLSFYNLRENKGLLRNLMLRSALSGEWMVLVQFGENDPEGIEKMLSALVAEFPELTSVVYVINQKPNDSIYDQEVHLYHGRDYIFEEMPSYFDEGKTLRFKVGPKSFYQTNPKQAYELYRTALDFAELKEGSLVYDLYTGTGTIANFMAQKAGHVVGIESVPTAIDDARFNAEINGFTNTTFAVGDMKDALTPDFVREHGMPQTIVTDPPRDGMHAKVVEQLIAMAPERIVYVSCNSATQARDLQLLNERYRIVRSRAVDMFPQTHHIENVAELILRD